VADNKSKSLDKENHINLQGKHTPVSCIA